MGPESKAESAANVSGKDHEMAVIWEVYVGIGNLDKLVNDIILVAIAVDWQLVGAKEAEVEAGLVEGVFHEEGVQLIAGLLIAAHVERVVRILEIHSDDEDVLLGGGCI